MPICYDNPLARNKALARVKAIEKFLDSAFMLPLLRMRVGFDGVLGLVPMLGNLVTTALSLTILYHAVRLGIKPFTFVKMLGNVGLDFVLGEVPVAGDIADFLFKANKRNLALLIEDIRNQEQSQRSFQASLSPHSRTTQTWSAPRDITTQQQTARRFVPNLAPQS